MYRSENQEKVQEGQKVWCENNRAKDKSREWNENNKDKKRQTGIEYRERNKDNLKQKAKEHYERNKEHIKERVCQYGKIRLECECGSITRKADMCKNIKSKI